MSLFAGYARQAAALPVRSAPVAPLPMQAGPGLFGARRPQQFGRLQTLLMGTNARDAAEDRNARMAEQERQARLAEEQRIASDRLRAQLSPADGPMGSGTGAMPSLDQQRMALDEARLLNPAVAEQFAPTVMERQRQQQAPELFANDPKAQALFSMGNQSFLDSLGEQYKPQVVAEGGLQSVYGEGATVRNPRTREFGNSLVRDTPGGVETVATREPDYSEQAALLNARRPQAVNTPAGGLTTILDPAGNPIGNIEGREDPAAVARREAAAAATAQGGTRALEVVGNTRAAVQRAREQTGGLSAGVLSGLIPANQWRANLAGTIETIQANLSFNELAQMRAASPTGGALGSIAVKELELLGATVASLNQNQSPEEFRRSLDVIDTAMARWQNAVEDSRTAPQGQAQGQQQPSGRSALEAEARRRGLIQ